MTDTSHLKALGSGSTKYNYDKPDAALLEKFVNPSFERGVHGRGGLQINIQAPEFTSLCPITGQPDFATIVIGYAPQKWCVESKSLKLYLMSYRNHGSFHEAIVDQIGHDLVELLDPMALQVEGRFTPRGGIPFWPKFLMVRQPTLVEGVAGDVLGHALKR